MKNNISITIEQELLDEVKSSFPNKNRSQVIEEALEFWTAQKKKNQLKEDAKKLSKFLNESKEAEEEALEDGLHGL
jgi:metal-responsive CopG/Arc/MetJ family transcriptional regulator